MKTAEQQLKEAWKFVDDQLGSLQEKRKTATPVEDPIYEGAIIGFQAMNDFFKQQRKANARKYNKSATKRIKANPSV